MEENHLAKRAFLSSKSRLRRADPEMREAIQLGELSYRLGARVTVPYKLEVKQSRIPVANLGVFSKRSWKKGKPIIMVVGEYRESNQQTSHERKYSYELLGRFEDVSVQMTDDNKSNIVKYINSAKGTKREPNVVILQHEGTLLMVYAQKDIKKGDELLADYSF